MDDEGIYQPVKIYTASPIDEETIKLLQEKFPFLKKEKIIYKIDPRLLAGVMIKTKDQIIDLSLRNRLIELKKIIYGIINR